ncbi:X-ray radiation resistance-associated protein 1 isoform X2 [Mixophyes fleayi]|uniref:X-ray radiation resistance-associated protein 1 isoform X2 n=1 Tax=Mixophyes fleayi TaxID=3061075 RepID=UPI003F4DD7E6
MARGAETGPEAAGLYRMASGGPHMTNCFPARSLFRTSTRGAGHWLIAQNNVQDKRFRDFVYSAEQKRRVDLRDITRCSRSRTDDETDCVLDTAFLMKTHCVKIPSDLCAVDVSDRNLTSAKAEEFVQFTCVVYMNSAENLLTLESFRTFPALRELDLSMNGIRRISINAGEFPQLEVLNLSYNTVSPRDIPQLGVFPRLRVLYLTGNGLTDLPLDLSVPPQKDADVTVFPSLEVLMLDDNELSHPDVFVSLAGLTSLRVLNLDRNALSAVPYLHQSGAVSPPIVGTLVGSSHKTQEAEMREDAEDLSEENLDYLVLPNSKDSDRTEVIFRPTCRLSRFEPLLKPLDTTASFSNPPGFLLSCADQLNESISPPLPNLRTLSLAENKILHEDDLLAVALFPSLDQLVIYGNPLTTLRKGDPPLLGNFLQQRLGIKIIRRKSTGLDKPHLIIPIKEKRKVRTHVPKVPKHPLMLESPLHWFLRLPLCESDVMGSVMSSTPLPPIRTSTESDTPLGQSPESAMSSETSEREISFSSDPTVQSVFMTQEGSLDPFYNSSPLTTAQEPDTSSCDQREIPENFRGYEELFDVKADPNFMEPVEDLQLQRPFRQSRLH